MVFYRGHILNCVLQGTRNGVLQGIRTGVVFYNINIAVAVVRIRKASTIIQTIK